jgi:hypothetical protein
VGKTRAIVAAIATVVVFAAALIVAGGPASATVSLNDAAPYTINVLPSMLTSAARSAAQAGLLAAGQQYNYAFSDSTYAAVSGALTASPQPVATALSATDAATFDSLTTDFAAPATEAAIAAKTVSGDALPLIAFAVGTLIGQGVSRLAGFKDDQVCAERSLALTVMASVLDGVDCSAWNSALTAEQKNLDANRPTYPDTCISGIGCWSFTGQVEYNGYGYVQNCFIGPNYPLNTLYSTNGGVTPSDFTVLTGFSNGSSFCGSPYINWFVSNLNSPVTSFYLSTPNSQTSSGISQVENSGPNPDRTWVCTISTTDGIVYTQSSDIWREADTTVAPIVCPSVPNGKTAARVYIVEHGGGADQIVMNVSTTTDYQNWRTTYSECNNGSCPLILSKAGDSCFQQGTACDGWLTDTNNTYTCTYGTHTVPLSTCNIYGPTFNTTDRATGHAYGDPTTGSITGPQTSPNETDVVTAALLGDTWVSTGSFPIVDPSNRPTLARQIAAACVAQIDHSNDITIIKVSPKEVCATIPTYSPGIDVSQAAQHDADAISQNQPFLLHFENATQKSTGTATVAPLPSGWYGDPTAKCSGPVVSAPSPAATNCDEYPFYSTVEAGPATPANPLGASLQNINAVDNRTQGNQLQQFYAACGIIPSTTASEANQYIVAPILASPSVAICGQ